MKKENDPERVVAALIDYIEKENFKGWDAYDALNSRLLQYIGFGNKYILAAFTQFFRISPVNFRRLFGIKKGYNPKGIGLFIESYTNIYKITKQDRYLKKAEELIYILNQVKSEGNGLSWGYNFPWQSRVVYKPRWTPTIVNTSFIGHSLLNYYEATNYPLALEMASQIPTWMLSDLNRDVKNDTFCFSYSPIDREFVHNANMLGASFLLRYGKLSGQNDLVTCAHQSLQYSINMQNDDGSWYFAPAKTHWWIDSFHTGFKLESIKWFIDSGEGKQYEESFKSGLEFYQKHFFLTDGTPKYYHNKVYPIDIHSPAEAIYFLSKLNDDVSTDIVNRVLDWTITNMFDTKKGYFYFRKFKNGTNKIPYMRWSEAWMLRGLSQFLFQQKIYGKAA